MLSKFKWHDDCNSQLQRTSIIDWEVSPFSALRNVLSLHFFLTGYTFYKAQTAPGSETDSLLRLLNRILDILDSDASSVKKSGESAIKGFAWNSFAASVELTVFSVCTILVCHIVYFYCFCWLIDCALLPYGVIINIYNAVNLLKKRILNTLSVKKEAKKANRKWLRCSKIRKMKIYNVTVYWRFVDAEIIRRRN